MSRSSAWVNWRTLTLAAIGLSLLVLLLSALLPAPASEFAVTAPTTVETYDEAWCDHMLEKPSGKWLEAETLAFSQNCI